MDTPYAIIRVVGGTFVFLFCTNRQPLLAEGGHEGIDGVVESPRNKGHIPAEGGAGVAGVAGGPSASRKKQNGPASKANATPTAVAPQHSQDYRSEGEQPSTERNGNRRMLSETSKKDSFRAARMPKRGGRKRLRRVRSVRRKIRVSSYCVARGLKTLPLLRWLEMQPNRRLSQRIRAEGGTVPQGPVGAATRTTAAAAAGGEIVAVAQEERKEEPSRRAVSMEAPSAVRPALDLSPGEVASTIDKLEWMDSLYIDVIHSTTDLRGGIRKARDLARPAWEDVAEEGGEEGGDWGGGSSWGVNADAGVEDDGGDGDRRGRERADVDEAENEDAMTHKDVIYFPYGAVVFWGCSEAEVCISCVGAHGAATI